MTTSKLRLFCWSMTGRYKERGDPKEADCVIAQAFGLRDQNGQFSPGTGNIELAAFILGDKTALIVAQDEVALCLSKMGVPSLKVGEMGDRITTHQVLRIELDLLTGLDCYRPMVACSAFHVGRILAMLQKVGVEAIVPAGLPGAFDPESAQWWTRGPWRFRAEEVLVWLHHWRAGWI